MQGTSRAVKMPPIINKVDSILVLFWPRLNSILAIHSSYFRCNLEGNVAGSAQFGENKIMKSPKTSKKFFKNSLSPPQLRYNFSCQSDVSIKNYRIM